MTIRITYNEFDYEETPPLLAAMVSRRISLIDSGILTEKEGPYGLESSSNALMATSRPGKVGCHFLPQQCARYNSSKVPSKYPIGLLVFVFCFCPVL